MKKILLIILCLNTCNNIFSQVQIYFSYPTRSSELHINDEIGILAFKGKWNGGILNPDDIHHYTIKNDTLYVNERTNYGNLIGFRKGEYLIFISDKFECEMLYREDSFEFQEEIKKIKQTTQRHTYMGMMELHKRIKQLEILGTCCEEPLPELKDYRF
jgi:hypothetical protein